MQTLSRLFGVGMLLISLSVAHATEFTIPGLRLNPETGFKADTTSPQHQTSRGFTWNISNDTYSATIKGTRFSERRTALQMAAIERTNVAALYKPRTNPYEGQVTSLVQCSEQLLPRAFQVKEGGVDVEGFVAGANSRRLFGACSKDQVAYWASYMNFYHPPSSMVIEARVFKKASARTPSEFQKVAQELSDLAQDLFIVDPSPLK